ncbi:HAD-IA family hydrolase [Nocardioides sp. KR10-350]|uniref:HAD-IA family hydrolase n=1 Tax=Nocardioides cheoyonin TaxID=3156615 RepID=UPI0032B31AB9
MSHTVVLFDLDGTLSDSGPSITASLLYAFEANGLPAPAADVLGGLVGPPLYESLPPLVGEELLWPMIEAYRAHYKAAMLDSPAFPGVADLLAALVADGRRLAVATSKPEAQAGQIVEAQGLAPYFETVGGDDLAGTRRTKALVIEMVLDRLGMPDPAGVVMVGDKSHDVLGARAHGIDCLGVRWGYALPGELEAVAPLAVCATVADLAAALGLAGI